MSGTAVRPTNTANAGSDLEALKASYNAMVTYLDALGTALATSAAAGAAVARTGYYQVLDQDGVNVAPQ